jgi:hypothetical protein
VNKDAPVYGLIAEFDNPEQLVDAIRRARAAGYRKMDAYTPFPVEHLSQELGFHRTALPVIVLIGGLIAAQAASSYSTGLPQSPIR